MYLVSFFSLPRLAFPFRPVFSVTPWPFPTLTFEGWVRVGGHRGPIRCVTCPPPPDASEQFSSSITSCLWQAAVPDFHPPGGGVRQVLDQV